MRVQVRNPAAEPNHQAVCSLEMRVPPAVGDVIDIAGIKGGAYVVDRRVWRGEQWVILDCSRC